MQNQCAAPQPHSIRINCIHDNEMRQKKTNKENEMPLALMRTHLRQALMLFQSQTIAKYL